MEFRPCIDIHNGKVKQIVGGSLKDEGNQAEENFVSEQDAAFFAKLNVAVPPTPRLATPVLTPTTTPAAITPHSRYDSDAVSFESS